MLFTGAQHEQLITGSHFTCHRDGHALSLWRCFYGVAVVVVNLRGGEVHHARRGTSDKQTVADAERRSLDSELCHANLSVAFEP